jgi:hypothetical protein
MERAPARAGGRRRIHPEFDRPDRAPRGLKRLRDGQHYPQILLELDLDGGGGARDAARCAAWLWSPLDTATGQLEATQGPDASAWRAHATAERISFAPGILARTMRGSNKPTFQQAVTFRSHR